ncbi:Ig-like domain-containing protein [Clostridium sp. HMP27]|uniref:Ig-like domain-containing protein n=1 Tax=Clostridium sp. HMP27 TaxID=1487921 RepID=UPI00052C1D6C|nr:Ig-like domain-containing protein [Clostridium sp. HMP27]KGK84183.1 hypothetical protein DP68_16525 [Clostridium sp. HMP27]
MSIKKTGKIFLILVITSMIIFNLPFTLNTFQSGLLTINKVAAKSVSPAITISSIDDINETVYINDKYTLPRTVKATMSDGSTKDVRVSWKSTRVTTNKADTYNYSGTVSGYSSKVKLTLTVVPIESIADISETIYINDSYTLPKTVAATMGDGSAKEVKVTWNKSTAVTKECGVHVYSGTVSGYSNKAKLTLIVIPIVSIADISEKIYINDSYTMPKTVIATMGDGSTKEVKVTWSSSKATVNKAGTTTYNGTVAGYSTKVKLILTVIGVTSVENINKIININDSFTLPTTLTAVMGDESTRDVKVSWSPSKPVTNKVGTYTYNGTVSGYSSKVKLTLTVSPISSIEDVNDKVYINDSYTFPKEVTATMSDGSTRAVQVKWKSSKAKTSEAGETTYTGTVSGYDKNVNLKLTVIGIASIDDIIETIDINGTYTLPKTIIATMGDGSTKSLEVKWNTSKIDTSKITQPDYLGTVNGYKSKVKLTLIINSITSISSIVSATVNQYDSYTLPATVTATMSDGRTKSVEVKWNPSKAKTSSKGKTTYTGTVGGYDSEIKFTLNVNPITLLTHSVNFGDNYTLPTKVDATMSDGSIKKGVGVIWDISEVDTSKLGKQTYIGKLNGYMNKVKLELTVKEENPIKSVEFKEIEKPKYSKTFNYASILKAEESKDKDPVITKGVITLTSSTSKKIRLDINNTAETKYNILYIDQNSDGHYDKGTDQIIGQFTIIIKGKFANTYNGLVDGIKVAPGDDGILVFRVYNVDGSKDKASTTINVEF